MGTLIAFLCPDVGGALAVLGEIRAMSGQERPIARDAIAVAWPSAADRPELRRAPDLPRSAPMNDAFWHLLFGHVCLLPIAAAAAGVPSGSSSCSLASLGIRDDFLESTRRRLAPGASALLLLTDDATVDRMLARLPRHEFTVTSTNLSRRQLHGLSRAFTGDATPQSWTSTTEMERTER
jgi:uncharacterized membrane protein